MSTDGPRKGLRAPFACRISFSEAPHLYEICGIVPAFASCWLMLVLILTKVLYASRMKRGAATNSLSLSRGGNKSCSAAVNNAPYRN